MIEALVLSIGEPQLPRCLASLENQTLPFDGIVHVENVVPQHRAYNQGISELKGDWFLMTAGDICLIPDGLTIMYEHIKKEEDDKVFGLSFDLYDPFMNDSQRIGIFKTNIMKTCPLTNRLRNDIQMGERLTSQGYYMRRIPELVGTHFDDPNEFQVFTRFYIYAFKHTSKRNATIMKRMNILFKSTGNPLYLLAIKGIEFFEKKREYPGSHNIEFDRKIYEEFKNAVQEA